MIVIKGEIHSSKNSRRIFVNKKSGKPFVAKSKASKDDEGSLMPQLNTQRETWKRMIAGKQYPLFVVFHFVRKTERRWDFANLLQGVADAMVKAEYLPDDDVNHFIPVWGGYTINKTEPGVEFWLEEQ